MRKLHRKIGLIFLPFLAVTAVTGLLWAYAPYLYLKPASAGTSAKSAVIDERGSYVPISDAVRSAKALAGDGRVTNVVLRPEGGRLLYTVNMAGKSGLKEVWVDAESGVASLPERNMAQQFHIWVMRLHRLQFFGTKKELVVIPGVGLLALLITGSILLKRSPRK